MRTLGDLHRTRNSIHGFGIADDLEKGLYF
jgi:hypothetical protein